MRKHLSFRLISVIPIFILPIIGCAQVSIDETNFPDKLFREYVKAFDTNEDGELSQEECDGVLSIDVSGNSSETSPLSNVEGIAFFPFLKYLDCSYTNLTDLDVSRNPALEVLFCKNTGITELEVDKNTGLKSLDCGNTGIEVLDVTNNPALEKLTVLGTAINTLDVSRNPKLGRLSCGKTGLKALDVSKNPDLDTLYCYSTEITSLDVSHNPALKMLSCFGTKITSLDVSANTELLQLHCYETGITSLDVSHNPVLDLLDCDKTGITSLDVSHNPVLQKLNCIETGITSLDVSQNPELTNLNCSKTGLTNLILNRNPKLYYLDCSGVALTSLDVSRNPELNTLRCANTRLTSLDLSQNSKLSVLYCSDTIRREVRIEEDGTYDLNRLSGFDLNRVSDWQGGRVQGTILTFDDTAVTYQYETLYPGKSSYVRKKLTFRLVPSQDLDIEQVLFEPVSGSVVKKGDKIKLSCATGGSSIYYGKGRDADPTEEYTDATNIVIVQDTTYITAFSMVKGKDTSEVVHAVYFMDESSFDTVVAPVFEPISGSVVNKGDTVRLSCATEKAKIYYGKGQGSEPTEEYTATTSIIIVQDTTYITALSMIADQDTSEVVCAVYYVGGDDSDPTPDTSGLKLPTGLEAEVDGRNVKLSWESKKDYVYGVRLEDTRTENIIDKELESAGDRTLCDISNLDKGSYNWAVRVIRVGETDTLSRYVYGEPFTIEEASASFDLISGIRIFPNPTTGELSLQVPEFVRMDIFTSTGIWTLGKELEPGTHRVELQASGLYLIRFTTVDGRSCLKRLIVR